MFNIKNCVDEEVSYRTVILTKTKVEINGKNKLIVMIRDVTDKVRLQQEHIKKTKSKDRTFRLQSNLDAIF